MARHPCRFLLIISDQIPAYKPQLFSSDLIYILPRLFTQTYAKEQKEPIARCSGPGLKVGYTQVMKRTYRTSCDQALLIFQSTFKVIASLFVNHRVMHFLQENKWTSINYSSFSHHFCSSIYTFGYFQLQF